MFCISQLFIHLTFSPPQEKEDSETEDTVDNKDSDEDSSDQNTL